MRPGTSATVTVNVVANEPPDREPDERQRHRHRCRLFVNVRSNDTRPGRRLHRGRALDPGHERRARHRRLLRRGLHVHGVPERRRGRHLRVPDHGRARRRRHRHRDDLRQPAVRGCGARLHTQPVPLRPARHVLRDGLRAGPGRADGERRAPRGRHDARECGPERGYRDVLALDAARRDTRRSRPTTPATRRSRARPGRRTSSRRWSRRRPRRRRSRPIRTRPRPGRR